MNNQVRRRQEKFETVYDGIFDLPDKKSSFKAGKSDLSKSQVMNAIKDSKQGKIFMALYENKIDSPTFDKYKRSDGSVDDSAADMALFGHACLLVSAGPKADAENCLQVKTGKG